MGAWDRTTYRSSAGSIAVDSLTKQILTVANTLLALPKFGGEVEPVTGTQGSFRPWTPYSGPTHRGCAAVDVTAYNWRNRFVVYDLLGITPTHRLSSEGNWPEHMHLMTRGLGCADPYLRTQIEEVAAGGDGLRGNRPDRDKKLRSGLNTLAVYQGRTGKLVATQANRLFDGPSSGRKPLRSVSKGSSVKALMEVRNRYGKVWFVTDKGEWGYSAKWVRA